MNFEQVDDLGNKNLDRIRTKMGHISSNTSQINDHYLPPQSSHLNH